VRHAFDLHAFVGTDDGDGQSLVDDR
jgi:hypothetical protein